MPRGTLRCIPDATFAALISLEHPRETQAGGRGYKESAASVVPLHSPFSKQTWLGYACSTLRPRRDWRMAKTAHTLIPTRQSM
jgi:hypothetical protein